MSDRRRMSMQSAPYPSKDSQWSSAAGPQGYSPYASSPHAQPPVSAYRATASSGAYSPDGYYSASPTSPYASPSSAGSAYPAGSYPYNQQPGYGGHAPGPNSPPTTRPRSHSQSYSSPPPPPPPHHQYPQQVPLTQATSYNDYPPSQARPYACDMCALSFNRQHDLKRHRETHSGEKNFRCDGPCGKTFTRKDALKRHQLVKGCGKVDEWS
uniref:C2H2-type domain-containing protein n=1 Tax=Mycena chlorophos TaxID=658473 RepID=A0ABQ0L4L8_MYCCL|nr:predicted protein [Mycena chlorophos]